MAVTAFEHVRGDSFSVFSVVCDLHHSKSEVGPRMSYGMRRRSADTLKAMHIFTLTNISRSFFWALLIFGFSRLARAQASTDVMTMDIADLSHLKVYSASRHLEDTREAPSSVSIITADQIKRYGWQTLADALQSLRGFYTSYDRGYRYLGVRGFLRPGDWNSRVLLLINGHRVNENVYGSAAFGTEFSLDLDLVDHIEVLRGPSSSLYGTNAMLGVIDVITRQAGPGNAAEFSGQEMPFLGRAGRVTAIGHLGNTSALLSVSDSKNPGDPTLYFPQFDSPSTNNGNAVNMDGERFDQVFADLEHGNFRVQGAFSDRLKTLPTGSFGAIFNDPADRVEDLRGFLEAKFTGTVHSAFEYEVRAFFDAYGCDQQGDYQVPNSTTSLVGHGKAKADWAGVQANLARQFGANRISIGTDVEGNFSIKQWDYYQGQPDAFVSNETPHSAAVYGNAELHVHPKVILHAGGEVDWYSTFGVALSPRLGAIYLPTDKTTLKYTYSRAFRAPNAYEESYVDGVTIEQAPHKLLPETVASSEGSIEHQVVPWLSLIGDGYYTTIFKLIDQQVDGLTGLSYFVNQGKVHSTGLEAELDVERTSGLSIRASYAVTNSENNQTTQPLANSPVGQAKVNASLPILGKGFVSAEALHINALTDYQDTRVPPYLLPSLTLSTKPLWNGWQFSASSYNALGHKWFSPMGPYDPEDQIRMDGRTFRFKVTYRLSPERRTH